jgi:hypothetical protein
MKPVKNILFDLGLRFFSSKSSLMESSTFLSFMSSSTVFLEAK